jgi:uncharacterized protein (UPF0261 family)
MLIKGLSKTALLVGTLDTKGEEYLFAKNRFNQAGIKTIIIDAGILGSPKLTPDYSNEVVAHAGGVELKELISKANRGSAVSAMTKGVLKTVQELFSKGEFGGIFALGGSSGSAISSAAMRSLPIGVPKILVSTLVGQNADAYVGQSDIALFASVVDIAGINRISSRVIANAVDAMIGMLNGGEIDKKIEKKIVAASMFGVTTQCVTQARKELEEAGLEVITFHMTGNGGMAMEKLITDGLVDAVLDVTTTELCDEIIGGILSAGPTRLTAAVKKNIPQVISLGALDMVNFGPKKTVPEKFKDRKLYVHNENVTLMRTTPNECRAIALDICNKLKGVKARTALIVPLLGISAIATKGQPFYDPEADEVLFSTIREHLPKEVELIELELAINDSDFSSALVAKLLSYLK